MSEAATVRQAGANTIAARRATISGNYRKRRQRTPRILMVTNEEYGACV